MTMPLPSLFIPHGGGPCFFMEWDPPETWTKLGAWLASVPQSLPQAPRAILVVSGHWEAPAFTLTGAAQPSLIYDYGGFPPHTYQLRYDAPGDPALAADIAARLKAAGLPSAVDLARGFDHGVFIPLKVMFPEARIPVLQLSLHESADPALHLALGRALAPLRDEGVLILGSGMSYHNLRDFFRPMPDAMSALDASRAFDEWLDATAQAEGETREHRLLDWYTAPQAKRAHPTPEHFLPFHVAAAAGGATPGTKLFHDVIMGTEISAYGFGKLPAR